VWLGKVRYGASFRRRAAKNGERKVPRYVEIILAEAAIKK
jgi:hypothetical protein